MLIRQLPRKLMALLVLVLLVIQLGACAPKRQQVNFVFMYTSDNTEPYWQSVIQDFEAENPDIQVNLYIFKWEDGQKKIQEMIDQGNPPSLARVATRWVPQYEAAGLLEPVDNYMTPEFRAQFIPLLINEGSQYEGRTFGLPITVTSRALYYNKELFRKAGITNPPQDWNDLREAAQAIDALGPDIHGFGIQGAETDTSTYFYYFLWGNGGNILTEDGTRPAFNGKEGQEALTFMKSMIDDGLTLPNPAETNRDALYKAFTDGKLGMVIALPTLTKKLATDAPNLDYGLAAIPYQTTPVTYVVGDTLILFKQAKNKEAAWKFVEFLYRDEYRLKYDLTEGVLPEKISVAENSQIKDNPTFSFFMETLPTGRFEPLNVKSADIASAVAEALQAAYRGEMSPVDALNEAAAQVLRMLSYSATSW